MSHADHSAAAAYYTAQAQQAAEFIEGARVTENPHSRVLSRADSAKLECLTVKLDDARIEVLYSYGSEDDPSGVVAVEVSGYWMRAIEVFDDRTRAELDEAALEAVKARGRAWL